MAWPGEFLWMHNMTSRVFLDALLYEMTRLFRCAPSIAGVVGLDSSGRSGSINRSCHKTRWSIFCDSVFIWRNQYWASTYSLLPSWCCSRSGWSFVSKSIDRKIFTLHSPLTGLTASSTLFPSFWVGRNFWIFIRLFPSTLTEVIRKHSPASRILPFASQPLSPKPNTTTVTWITNLRSPWLTIKFSLCNLPYRLHRVS